MAYRFIGYAIVSEDGMLADATGIIPPSLIVKADQEFLMRGLDAAAALVHGRNSAEQPTSPHRPRLIATHKIQNTETIPGQPNALLWNPHGMSVEGALAKLGINAGDIGALVNASGPSLERTGQVAAMIDAIGARVWLIGRAVPALPGATVFALPETDELISPLLAVVPFQLLAYQMAVEKGINPDRFRRDDPAFAAALAFAPFR